MAWLSNGTKELNFRQSDKNWASRLPMILLGLRARPDHTWTLVSVHTSKLSGPSSPFPPTSPARRRKSWMGWNSTSNWRKWETATPTLIIRRMTAKPLTPWTSGRQRLPQAFLRLRKAKFVLVRQGGHKPPLAEVYRGPYKVKSIGSNLSTYKKARRSSTSSRSRGEDVQPESPSQPLRGRRPQPTLRKSGFVGRRGFSAFDLRHSNGQP